MSVCPEYLNKFSILVVKGLLEAYFQCATYEKNIFYFLGVWDKMVFLGFTNSASQILLTQAFCEPGTQMPKSVPFRVHAENS